MQINLYAVYHDDQIIGELAVPGNRSETDPIATKMSKELEHRPELGSPSIVCQSSENPSQIKGYNSARRYWQDLTDTELAAYWVRYRKDPYHDSNISFADYIIQSAVESEFSEIYNI